MKKLLCRLTAIFLSCFLPESAKAETWTPIGDQSLSTVDSRDIILGYGGFGTFRLLPGGAANSIEGIDPGGGSLFFSQSGGVSTINNTTPSGVNTILSHITIGSDTTVNTSASLNARIIDVGFENSVLTINGGTIGSSGSLIQINHNAILNYNGGTIAGLVTSEANGEDATFNINTNFNTTNGVGSSGVSIGNLSVATGVTLTSSSGVYAKNINITGTTTMTGGTLGNSASTINLNSGGILNLNGGSVGGTIRAGSSGSGTININQNYSSAAIIGSSSLPINTINVASGKTFTSNYDVSANAININGTANVTSGNFGYSGSTIDIASGGKLSLSGGSVLGTVRGASSGVGTVEVSGNVTNSTAIGTSGNPLAALNVLSGSTFTTSANIFATQTNIIGSLIFSSAGTINGDTTVNGGTLSLTGGSTINGDLTIDGSSRLNIGITNSSSTGSIAADNITINSNADLTVNIDANSDYIPNNTSFTILNDGGAGSGINDIKDIQNGTMVFSTSKDSGTGDLILTITRVSPSSITTADHARTVYINIEEGVGSAATGSLRAFRNYLNSSSVSDAQRDIALKSAAPQVDNSANRNSINLANLSIKNIESRFRNYQESGKSSGDEMQNYGLWTKVFGSNVQQGVRGDDDGYNANASGISFGADKEVDDDNFFGAGFTFANSNISSFSKDKGMNVKTYQLDIYGRHDFEKLFVDGIIGAAINRYDSTRLIALINSSANANYNGRTYIAKLRGGMVNRIGDFSVIPTIALTSVRSSTQSYTENDAGTMSLNIARNNFDFLEGRAGLNFSYHKILANGTKITPELYISYGHDFIGQRQFTTGNFVGQSAAFTSHGTKVDQNSWILGSELNIFYINNIDFNFNYNFEHKTKYDAHSAFLKARWNF